jgi:hypothetical protein
MKKYRITKGGTSVSFEAQNLLEASKIVRERGLSGTLKEVKEIPQVRVSVTCGWGKNCHKWETTLADAIEFRNTCPDHR